VAEVDFSGKEDLSGGLYLRTHGVKIGFAASWLSLSVPVFSIWTVKKTLGLLFNSAWCEFTKATAPAAIDHSVQRCPA